MTDLAMALLLLFLMAYFITEQEIHEWLGVGMLVLFLLHHGLNWKWFQALARGRYTPRRILQTVLVLLLFVSMAAQIISGLAMARHVPPFLEIPVSIAAARQIHLACGYWSFLLTGLHLGLHWGIFLGLGRKLRGGRPLPPGGALGPENSSGCGCGVGRGVLCPAEHCGLYVPAGGFCVL